MTMMMRLTLCKDKHDLFSPSRIFDIKHYKK
jgi:hypothetical protein